MTITAIDVRTWVGPGLTCALLYFAMSYPLGVLARRLEKKLEGERETGPQDEPGDGDGDGDGDDAKTAVAA
jgi:polar amino acid transport system substrate-binding protein